MPSNHSRDAARLEHLLGQLEAEAYRYPLIDALVVCEEDSRPPEGRRRADAVRPRRTRLDLLRKAAKEHLDTCPERQRYPPTTFFTHWEEWLSSESPRGGARVGWYFALVAPAGAGHLHALERTFKFVTSDAARYLLGDPEWSFTRTASWLMHLADEQMPSGSIRDRSDWTLPNPEGGLELLLPFDHVEGVQQLWRTIRIPAVFQVTRLLVETALRAVDARARPPTGTHAALDPNATADTAPVITRSLPADPPIILLTSWAEIIAALNEPHGKVVFRNTETERNKVRKLNAEYNGPIMLPQRKGAHPKVGKAELLDWYLTLRDRVYENDREDEQRAADIDATVADTYRHGRFGEVVPGVGGHVTKSKRKPK